MPRDTELAVRTSGFKNNYWGNLICRQRWADSEHDGGKGTVWDGSTRSHSHRWVFAWFPGTRERERSKENEDSSLSC